MPEKWGCRSLGKPRRSSGIPVPPSTIAQSPQARGLSGRREAKLSGSQRPWDTGGLPAPPELPAQGYCLLVGSWKSQVPPRAVKAGWESQIHCTKIHSPSRTDQSSACIRMETEPFKVFPKRNEGLQIAQKSGHCSRPWESGARGLSNPTPRSSGSAVPLGDPRAAVLPFCIAKKALGEGQRESQQGLNVHLCLSAGSLGHQHAARLGSSFLTAGSSLRNQNASWC